MYKPAGLVNIMKKDNNNTIADDSKKLIPKCLVSFFLTIHFIWGLDFGFIKHFGKKIQKAAQFVTFILNILAISILSLPFSYVNINPSDFAWHFSCLLQYIIDIFVLNCAKYKLYDFLIDVSVIKFEKSHKSVMIDNFYGFAMIVCVFGIQIIKYIIYIFHCKNEIYSVVSLLPVPYEIFGIWYFCTDFVPFVLIVIYYYIYVNLKNIKKSVQVVTFDLNYIEEQYEGIADCYDKIMPLYDNIVSKGILFSTNTALKLNTLKRNVLSKHDKHHHHLHLMEYGKFKPMEV